MRVSCENKRDARELPEMLVFVGLVFSLIQRDRILRIKISRKKYPFTPQCSFLSAREFFDSHLLRNNEDPLELLFYRNIFVVQCANIISRGRSLIRTTRRARFSRAYKARVCESVLSVYRNTLMGSGRDVATPLIPLVARL